ncbi:MAG: hypothetical protein WBH50_09325, partial [Fuerstiella sp.]
MLRARWSHVGRSDNGAARRFERAMSCSQPRHGVKGEDLVRVLLKMLRARCAHVRRSDNGAARRFERAMS